MPEPGQRSLEGKQSFYVGGRWPTYRQMFEPGRSSEERRAEVTQLPLVLAAGPCDERALGGLSLINGHSVPVERSSS